MCHCSQEENQRQPVGQIGGDLANWALTTALPKALGLQQPTHESDRECDPEPFLAVIPPLASAGFPGKGENIGPKL